MTDCEHEWEKIKCFPSLYQDPYAEIPPKVFRRCKKCDKHERWDYKEKIFKLMEEEV